MKNYRNSDYAVNKYADGIVYRFNDSTTLEITLERYLMENPDKTEQDFAELKKISDEIYLEQVTAENNQTYKNVPYDKLGETLLCCEKSPEEILVSEIDEQNELEKRR